MLLRFMSNAFVVPVVIHRLFDEWVPREPENVWLNRYLACPLSQVNWFLPTTGASAIDMKNSPPNFTFCLIILYFQLGLHHNVALLGSKLHLSGLASSVQNVSKSSCNSVQLS